MPGMGGAAPTAAATVAVPVAQLLQRLASHIPLMGVCLTRAGSEVAVVTPAGAKHGHAADWWQHPGAVQHVAGGHLTSDALLKLVMEHKVGGVVLGGSGLFRTDGKTHYGARKLIAGIAGIEYDSDWLPKVAKEAQRRDSQPIWLCRAGKDEPCSMLVDYIRRNTRQDPPANQPRAQ